MLFVQQHQLTDLPRVMGRTISWLGPVTSWTLCAGWQEIVWHVTPCETSCGLVAGWLSVTDTITRN